MKGRRVHILVVDDNAAHAETIREALERAGYQVQTVSGGEEARERLGSCSFEVVITDLKMKDLGGMELLEFVKSRNPFTEVILITGYGSVGSAVEAMRKGAFDYLEKPINLKVLRAKVEKALEKVELHRKNVELREQLDERFKFEGLVGHSAKMQRVLQKISIAASSHSTVLITGEVGTGKEMVAKVIHRNSARRDYPFVAVNCAAIPEALLESELFGTEAGAFTGATARKGKIEYAHRGTFFLDEIGDMPLSLQAKLLRVLEEREITRLGSNETVEVDVRFMAATNVDLCKAVEENRFRRDLYYRLRVLEIVLPPLRERQEDIPLLVDHFIREFSQKNGKRIRGISPEVRRLLFRHSWPGNVRELKACIETMVVSAQGEVLTLEDAPEWILESTQDFSLRIPPGYSWKEYEEAIIRSTLELTKGNRAEAAKTLGIGERTLYRRIKEFGLEVKKET